MLSQILKIIIEKKVFSKSYKILHIYRKSYNNNNVWIVSSFTSNNFILHFYFFFLISKLFFVIQKLIHSIFLLYHISKFNKKKFHQTSKSDEGFLNIFYNLIKDIFFIKFWNSVKDFLFFYYFKIHFEVFEKFFIFRYSMKKWKIFIIF